MNDRSTRQPVYTQLFSPPHVHVVGPALSFTIVSQWMEKEGTNIKEWRVIKVNKYTRKVKFTRFDRMLSLSLFPCVPLCIHSGDLETILTHISHAYVCIRIHFITWHISWYIVHGAHSSRCVSVDHGQCLLEGAGERERERGNNVFVMYCGKKV